MIRVQTFGHYVLAVMSVGVALYAAFAYGILEPGTTVHPQMKVVYALHPAGIYTHVFGALIALFIGPFLLMERFRSRYIRLHRLGGRIYLVAGVLVGGLGGLYMAQYAFGGLVSQAGFTLLALTWLYTGYRGYRSIRRKDIPSHRQWMIRNFALTFAAVTFRIDLGLFFAAGIAFEAFYPLVAWLCWVPNILFVEWVLLSSNNREGRHA